METAGETEEREDEFWLDQCRAAKTVEEQKQCFEDLAEFLEGIETQTQTQTERQTERQPIGGARERNRCCPRSGRDGNESGKRSKIPSGRAVRIDGKRSGSLKVLAVRERIARCVLTTWPYGQVSAHACIDRVLDACSPVVAISTCSSLLKEIAAASDLGQNNHDCNDNHLDGNEHDRPVSSSSSSSLLSWTAKTSSLPLRSIVQACWTTIQRMLLTVPSVRNHGSPSPVPSNTGGNDKTDALEWQRFVSSVVLLLPQTLANACHVVKLQVPLRGTPTHFYPRLVSCAWRRARAQIRIRIGWQAQSGGGNDCSHATSADPVVYAKRLITQMVRTRRGDQVAQGLMRQSSETNSDAQECDGERSGNGARDVLSFFLVSLDLAPRDMAALVFAMLQHASVPGCTGVDHDKVQSHRHRDSANRTRSICNNLFWASTVEHQEAITEQLVFHSRASVPGRFASNGKRGHERGHERDRNGGATPDSKSREKARRRWSRWVADVLAPHPEFNGGSERERERSLSFSHHLASIADRWSQWTFLQEADGRLQHHVSLVLSRGLVRLESPRAPASSLSLRDPSQRKLTTSLVNGVSHRLGSTLVVPRQDGMRIAQQMARGLGQDGLRFDEYIPDDDSSTDAEDCEDCDVDSSRKTERNQPKKRGRGFVDPDEDYESEEEEDEEVHGNREVDTDSKPGDRKPLTSSIVDSIGDNDSDNDNDNESESDNNDDDLSIEWEDELLPYDLDDDEEDLRQTPRPLHLLEALDLLRTGDNHDHAYSRHEAALDALPELIRARPDDLGDVAVSLVLELLRMQDKFDIEDFGSKREAAMRALVVEEPASVGQTLIEQLFEESGLSDKLAIVACLQGAAFELSGNKDLIEGMMKKAEERPSPAKMNLPSESQRRNETPKFQKDQTLRVLTKTRRKRSRAQQKAIRNQFSSVAPMWFYSLIAGFIKHKENEVLWTGSTGSILLTYFLRCLATIVEFSGVQVAQVLANDLLNLVWDFRSADVAEVRLSVLVAVSTSIAMLSDEKLIALLYGEARLPKTMLEMSHNDPDKECRSLCKTISVSIHEVLKTNF